MGKKQTAVDWLLSKLREPYSDEYIQKIIQMAKAMEKQQIVDAVTFGNRQEFYDATETLGASYYNETYGGNK